MWQKTLAGISFCKLHKHNQIKLWVCSIHIVFNLNTKDFLDMLRRILHMTSGEIQHASFNLHMPHTNLSISLDAWHRTLSKFHGHYIWWRSHHDIYLQLWPLTLWPLVTAHNLRMSDPNTMRDYDSRFAVDGREPSHLDSAPSLFCVSLHMAWKNTLYNIPHTSKIKLNNLGTFIDCTLSFTANTEYIFF